MLNTIKKILTQTCIFYTVLITAMYTLGMLTGGSSWIPTLRIVYCLLLFSLLFSVVNHFLSSDALIFSLRLIIHFVVTGILFFFIFALGSGFIKNGGSAITVAVGYTLIYAICALFVFIYRYIFGTEKVKSAKEKKEERYTPQFGKK